MIYFTNAVLAFHWAEQWFIIYYPCSGFNTIGDILLIAIENILNSSQFIKNIVVYGCFFFFFSSDWTNQQISD